MARMGTAICAGIDCGRPVYAKGMCAGHYNRDFETGDAHLDVPIGKMPKRERRVVSKEETAEAAMRNYRIRRDRDPADQSRRSREAHLRQVFGMSVHDLEYLLRSQGGCCPLCRVELDSGIHVDHDHKCCPGRKSCGQCVRGLLCPFCNKNVLPQYERFKERARIEGGAVAVPSIDAYLAGRPLAQRERVRRSPAPYPGVVGFDVAELRRWAEEHSVNVPRSGRIPRDVVAQYLSSGAR